MEVRVSTIEAVDDPTKQADGRDQRSDRGVPARLDYLALLASQGGSLGGAWPTSRAIPLRLALAHPRLVRDGTGVVNYQPGPRTVTAAVAALLQRGPVAVAVRAPAHPFRDPEWICHRAHSPFFVSLMSSMGLQRSRVTPLDSARTRWQDAHGHRWCSDRLSPQTRAALSTHRSADWLRGARRATAVEPAATLGNQHVRESLSRTRAAANPQGSAFGRLHPSDSRDVLFGCREISGSSSATNATRVSAGGKQTRLGYGAATEPGPEQRAFLFCYPSCAERVTDQQPAGIRHSPRPSRSAGRCRACRCTRRTSHWAWHLEEGECRA